MPDFFRWCIALGTTGAAVATQVVTPYPLGTAKTMRFQVECWKPAAAPPHRMTLSSKALVTAARPASLRVELLEYYELRLIKPGKGVMLFGSKPPELIVADEKTQKRRLPYNTEIKTYPGATDLTDVFNDDGPELLLYYYLLFEKNPIKEHRFVAHGVKPFDGGEGLLYVWNERKEMEKRGKHPTRILLYLSVKERLPLLFSEQVLDDRGQWVETQREQYSNWRLNLPVPAETFNMNIPTRPPASKVMPVP